MNPKTILLIMRLTSIGIDIMQQLDALMKRVQAGDVITDAEIEAARKQVEESVAKWDAAAKQE